MGKGFHNITLSLSVFNLEFQYTVPKSRLKIHSPSLTLVTSEGFPAKTSKVGFLYIFSRASVLLTTVLMILFLSSKT
jgi:hypothetical protein